MKNRRTVLLSWRWCLPALLVASAGGFGAGYINTHVSPPHAHVAIEAIELMFVTGILGGSLCPRLAWLLALLVGLGVPAFHVAVQVGGLLVPRPASFGPADLLGPIPASFGAAAGAAGRVFLGQPIPRDHD